MKKKLEADLISIAHRILQLKNKSDINQLYLETQKLYEKLSVLRFVEEHFSEAKPTIGIQEINREIESIFDKTESVQPEAKAIIEKTVVEEIAETPLEQATTTADESESETNIVEEETIEVPLEETISNEEVTLEEEKEEPIIEEEIVVEEKETSAPEMAAFTPAFELSQEEEVETEVEAPKKMEPVQISFEDLLGGNYHDTQFVKVQQIENIPTAVVIETPKEIVAEEEETVEPKTVSLNEKLAKGINIDLNDRIAFIKHLFGNSSEDYNRVLNQLITFDTFYETRDFIQEMVKPDYNNWEGKQEYEERFMDIIEKKFL
ncbi:MULTISPECIES: hypothetical protein [Flavobacterium]|uniref:DUF4476 domain-containing protein n=1 Tax=Flavobacterium algoritolerans TaxID=3041254 RepID=A0ABT6V6K8_9FLAO|nr:MULTISPECIES: hypothetical protein [Flavobacterium]MDI5886851.1 hypothetical protein [Flavobacterium yafengii]MDI5893865.1 hypothetical protein [Flavobacterium algoritolerans]